MTRKRRPARRHSRSKRTARVKRGSAAVRARNTSTQDNLPQPGCKTEADPAGFCTVGIGASAGGLEALEHFFRVMPANSGLAFVVVTHQHPGHASLLQDLLKNHTHMPVNDVVDGTDIKPNHVYVAVAGKNLAIMHGVLYNLDIEPKSQARLPIDFFFRSLAQDQKHKAIGIVLSGAGSDGTLGLRAIKGEAGITIGQHPEEAEYPGMPQSAIAAKTADAILKIDEMPDRLMAYLRDPTKLPSHMEAEASQDLPKIFAVIRDRTGNDFSMYKQRTVLRRIERRMTVHEIGTLKQYLRFLHEDPHEADALFSELLIGVTSFFRDPPAFDMLWRRGIVPLLKGKPDGYTLRIWVPGCSTGEEAYSLAILLRENLSQRKKRFGFQIFASDLDKQAIETARTGLYAAGIANDIPTHRLKLFFTKENGGYRVNKEIRNTVIFAVHNLFADPPFTKMDVISCRNLLIYLEPKAQRQALVSLHYALKPDGLLLLGSSETASAADHLFMPLERKWKLFAARNVDRAVYIHDNLPARYQGLVGMASHATQRHLQPSWTMSSIKGSGLIENMLLDRYAPASAIVNDQGDILYIHGRTGAYLEPAPGPPTRNIVEMAREGLRTSLAAALVHISPKTPVFQQRVRIRRNGSETMVMLTVKRLEEPASLRGLLLVTFESGAKSGAPAGKLVKIRSEKANKRAGPALLEELEFTKHRLQQTNEEFETSNEEFKATNEELQSTNEELQSTNEELETAKEELQSLNEELVTLNSELQGKLDELAATSDDLQNLLNSTEVATIFLDTDLRIRRFTQQARQIINLIPTDIGRPLSDIVTHLKYPNFMTDIQEVMESLVRKEIEVQTTDDKWYFIRILPYRTAQNVIDGIVVAFLDVTQQKQAEETTASAARYAQSIVDTVRSPLIVLDAEFRVVSANAAFYETFRIEPRRIEGQSLYEIANSQWNIPKVRRMLEGILSNNHPVENMVLEHDFPGLGRRKMNINASRLDVHNALPAHILIAIENITDGQKPDAGERHARA